MLARMFIVAAFFAATAAISPAATPHPVFWCDWQLDRSTDKTDAQGLAQRKLCNGDAEGARLILAPMLPSMIRRQGDGSVWVSYEILYFYTLLASHHDPEAYRLLADRGPNTVTATPAPAERAFFDGKYADSFADLVADDAGWGAGDPGSHVLSPHLPAALAKVRSGDVAGAIHEMATVESGSLYDLMRGNLYAQQRDWDHAFSFWKTAAEDQTLAPQMEFYVMDEWNESALDMMYYYRAHAPVRPPVAGPQAASTPR
jgi:hypothetical protein